MSVNKTHPALFGRSLPAICDLIEKESDEDVEHPPFELPQECQNKEEDYVTCEDIVDGLLKSVENASNEKEESCISQANFDGVKNTHVDGSSAENESAGPSVTEFQSIVSDLHQKADKYVFSQQLDVTETAQTIALPESQQKFSNNFNNNFKESKSNQTDSLLIVSRMSQTDDQAPKMKDSETQSMLVETQEIEVQTTSYKKDSSTQTETISTAEDECQTDELEKISTGIQVDIQFSDPNQVITKEASTSTQSITSPCIQTVTVKRDDVLLDDEKSLSQTENNNYEIVDDDVVIIDVKTKNDRSTSPKRPNEIQPSNVLEKLLEGFLDIKNQDKEIRKLKEEIHSLKTSKYCGSSLQCLPNEFSTFKQHEERMDALRKSNENTTKLFEGYDFPNTSLLSNASRDNSSLFQQQQQQQQQQQGSSASQITVQPFLETVQSGSLRAVLPFNSFYDSSSVNQSYYPLQSTPIPNFLQTMSSLYENSLPTQIHSFDTENGLNEPTPSVSSNTAQTQSSKNATKRKTSDSGKRPAKRGRGRMPLSEEGEQYPRIVNENVDLDVRGTKTHNNKKSQSKESPRDNATSTPEKREHFTRSRSARKKI